MLYMNSSITQDRERPVAPQVKERLVPEDTNANTNFTSLTAGTRLLKQEGIYPDFKFHLLSACLPGNAVSCFHPSLSDALIPSPICYSEHGTSLQLTIQPLFPAHWQSPNVCLTIIIYQLFMA